MYYLSPPLYMQIFHAGQNYIRGSGVYPFPVNVKRLLYSYYNLHMHEKNYSSSTK